MSGWAGREVGPGPGEDCYSFECEIFNINLIKFGSVTKTKLAGLVAGRGPGVRSILALGGLDNTDYSGFVV